MTDPTVARIEFHEHPEYAAKSDDWQTYRDLYEGKKAVLTSPRYLIPHELEGSKQILSNDPVTGIAETVGERIRRIRVQRTEYFNTFEPVVSTLVSMAFAKPIEIDDATRAMLGEAIDNIDGQGTNFENFIKGPLAIAYFRDGRPYLYVDAPENTAVSRAEERALGFRPFMEVLDVLAVKDWQLAALGPRAGKYDLIRFEEEIVAPRTTLKETPKLVTYCKVLSMVDGVPVIEVFERDDEDNSWKPYGAPRVLSKLSEIPVSTVVHNESWVKDVAPLQRVLLNLMSAHYNLLNMQAFQRIIIAGDQSQKNVMSVSEFALSFIAAGSQVTVIEPSSTAALETAIDRTFDQIQRVAFNRSRGVASDSKEAPGAETLREMHAELVDLLVQAVGELEAIVNQALRHFAIFKLGDAGKSFTGKVTFSRDITPEDVNRQLALFAAYRDEIRKVLPWRKAHLRKVASAMGYGEEDLKEILAEIEKLQKELPPTMLGLGAYGGRQQFGRDEEEDGEEEESPTETPDEAPDNL